METFEITSGTNSYSIHNGKGFVRLSYDDVVFLESIGYVFVPAPVYC